jgi:hypothetical protein
MSKKYKPVHFKCDHDSKGVSTKIEVSTFHPLTKRGIWNLLRHAQQTGNSRTRNSIQIRLCQGIKGHVCPMPIAGLVVQKENEISELYLDNGNFGPTNILVNKLFNLMNV